MTQLELCSGFYTSGILLNFWRCCEEYIQQEIKWNLTGIQVETTVFTRNMPIFDRNPLVEMPTLREDHLDFT